MADARTGKRFPVHLPIKLLSGFAPGQRQQGTTENISAAGVYIWVDEALELDQRVEFEITMPAAVIGAKEDAVLHCSGRVVRSDTKPEQKPGVACLIDDYEFVRRGAGKGC